MRRLFSLSPSISPSIDVSILRYGYVHVAKSEKSVLKATGKWNTFLLSRYNDIYHFFQFWGGDDFSSDAIDVLYYEEYNNLACWRTTDEASKTFKILVGDFKPMFGYYQGGSISTGEQYTRGNMIWDKNFTPDIAEYRETKICYPVSVGITIYNKSDNSVFCPEY